MGNGLHPLQREASLRVVEPCSDEYIYMKASELKDRGHERGDKNIVRVRGKESLW